MKITCSMCQAKQMIPCGSHSTHFESFLIVSTKTGKKKVFENQWWNLRPGMTFEQREWAIGMLTAGMSARDVARHFKRHESTIMDYWTDFSKLGTSRTDPDQADRIKPCRGKTVFSRLHLDATDGITESVVVPYLQQHNVGIFQHDNARPNTARHTQNILRIHDVNVLQWPAKSPDLSPIEHLWDHLGRQLRERHGINNIPYLERALRAELVRIPSQVIRKLICSMRRHCLAVLAANGGHTRYWAVSEFLRLNTPPPPFISNMPETKRRRIME